jgi:hypothetical protein
MSGKEDNEMSNEKEREAIKKMLIEEMEFEAKITDMNAKFDAAYEQAIKNGECEFIASSLGLVAARHALDDWREEK